MSTLVCVALGVGAVGAWHAVGGEARGTAEVGTLRDALNLARNQRVRGLCRCLRLR